MLVMTGVALLLGFGPSLQILGRDTGLAMPYALLQGLPVMRLARRPDTFMMPGLILLMVFAGIGLSWMLARRRAWQRPVILGVVIVAALVELWPPTNRLTVQLEAPDFFATIRARPGAVLDLPYEWDTTSRALRHQMIHGQPVVGGYLARRPSYEIRRYMPLLNQLSEIQLWPARDIIPLAADDLAAMQCVLQLRHIVVARDKVTPQELQALETLLGQVENKVVTPTFADSHYAWYELPLFADRCRPFAYTGQGWHPLETTGAQSWRWAGASSDIWLVNPGSQPVTAVLTLDAEAYGFDGTMRQTELWYQERLVAHGDIGRQQRRYRLLIQLPPGWNRFVLKSDATFDESTQREVSIAVTSLSVATP